MFMQSSTHFRDANMTRKRFVSKCRKPNDMEYCHMVSVVLAPWIDSAIIFSFENGETASQNISIPFIDETAKSVLRFIQCFNNSLFNDELFLIRMKKKKTQNYF